MFPLSHSGRGNANIWSDFHAAERKAPAKYDSKVFLVQVKGEIDRITE